MPKVAVVTGHKSGLGKAIYARLMKEGYIIHGVDKEVDITNCEHVMNTFKDIWLNENIIDVLINCAGVNHLGDLVNYDESDWNETIDVNLKGAYLTSKAFARYNTYRRNKHPFNRTKFIINIGSNTADISRTRSFAYAASKRGLQALTRCLARELAPHKIAVIQLDCGVIGDTPMHQRTHEDLFKQRGWDEKKVDEMRLANIPWGRYSNTKEIVEWIWFLLNHGEYATGNCIRIDGGEK